jgi:outer membrane protein assembly factor BamB
MFNRNLFLTRLTLAQLFFLVTLATAYGQKRPAKPSVAPEAVGTWAQWRGPARDGVSLEKDLLSTWPEAGPPILWKAPELGGGFSSVAVAGDRLVTLGKIGNDTLMIALSVTDGSKLWSTKVGSGGDAPNGTPTIDGDLVYGISHGGDLLCAKLETGEAVWHKNFAQDFGGKMMSSWGFSESPLVDGDKLIVTPGASDGMLVALNKQSGDTIWKAAMHPNPGPAGQDGAGYSSAVISNAAGVKQYVQFVGRGVIGVEAETGKLLWGYNKIANGTANVPTPVVVDDYVFCSSGYDDGGSALLKIMRGRNGVSAQEIWYKNNKQLQNHHGGMVLIGKNIYMGHGHNNGFPVCFDLVSGREMWKPGRGVGQGSAAVVAADNHLYFRYEDGTLALIEAVPDKYKLKSSFKIPINNGQSWSHPVIAGGKLFLRDQHEMLCMDIRSQ